MLIADYYGKSWTRGKAARGTLVIQRFTGLALAMAAIVANHPHADDDRHVVQTLDEMARWCPAKPTIRTLPKISFD